MSQALTALYADPATAERAMERLRAIGVPQDGIEMHRAGEGDVVPGNAPSGGLFGLRDLLAPESDRRGAELGVAGGTVVVASAIPDNLLSEARDILREEATEVDG